MPVNQEELLKDLDTPEYQKVVTEKLRQKEFTVFNKDEQTAFMERHKQSVIETEIPQKIKEVHDRYDVDTKTLFGIDRNADEKSYDYLKRAATVKLGEIAALKEQLKGGDPTGAIKKQLEETEQKYRQTLQEKDAEINTLKTNLTRGEITTGVTTVYTDIKNTFKKPLPPLFDQTERSILNDVVSKAVLKEGKYYLGDGNGNLVKDRGLNPVLLSDHLKETFKDLIDTGAGGGGAGSKDASKGGKTDPTTITPENFFLPEKVKTKANLIDHMVEDLGIPKGTKQFNTIYAKWSKDLAQI